MLVGDIRKPDLSWIAHDHLGAATDRALHLHRDDGVCFAGIAPDHEEEVRISDLRDAVRHRARTEGGDQTGHRWGVSRCGALVTVIGAECRPGNLLHQVVFFSGTARR